MICPRVPRVTLSATLSDVAVVLLRLPVSQLSMEGLQAYAQDAAMQSIPYRALKSMVGSSPVFGVSSVWGINEKSMRSPKTRKLMPDRAIGTNDPQDHISYLSARRDVITVETKAIAYGGTVNSCALRFSKPSPATIVGANS